MNIFTIGTGYVGLVQAAGLAFLGHHVVGIDINKEKVASLKNGQIPFYEPGLEELVRGGQQKGLLTFTDSYEMAATTFVPDVVFICVQTPKGKDGEANLDYVISALKSLEQTVGEKTTVVIKSTIPPGSLEVLEREVPRLAPLAVNPEFLRQGKSVKDFISPDRIVLGVSDGKQEDDLRFLYKEIDAPMIVTNPVTAQLIKYAANSMLALRLSFMNELANISELLGGHIKDVEKALSLDPRIGSQFLRSSAGFGGSCFPKDVLALHEAGCEAGYVSKLIAPIIQVNDEQPVHFVNIAEEHFGHFSGKKIAVWGLAFNAGTDDTRESPAIRIVKELLKRGAQVQAFDPQAMEPAKRELGDRIEYEVSREAALEGADVLFVLTEWPEFKEVDWGMVKRQLARPMVFDAKHFLPYEQMKAEGLEVYGIGL